MDFMQPYGSLLLGTRLRRLSEYVSYDAGRFYKRFGINLHPGSTVLLMLLQRQREITLAEAARELAMTHAAIRQRSALLLRQGYVTITPDAADKRQKILRLTVLGEDLLLLLAPFWSIIHRAADDLLAQLPAGKFMELLDQLDELAHTYNLTSLIETERKASAKRLQIIPFTPQYAEVFAALNRDWLRRYFVIELRDEEVLGNPQQEIVEKGGYILLASVDGQVVGTVSLISSGKTYEVSKMAVNPVYQGAGIGRMLLRHALAKAEQLGMQEVFLLTSSKLEAANRLYLSEGFVEQPVSEKDQKLYKRANKRYVYTFSGSAVAAPPRIRRV